MPFEDIDPFLVSIPVSPDLGKKVAKRPDWALIEVDHQDHPYYVGFQSTDANGKRICRICPTPVITSHFRLMLAGDEMVIFASRTLEELRPLRLLHFERKPLMADFDPAMVTHVE